MGGPTKASSIVQLSPKTPVQLHLSLEIIFQNNCFCTYVLLQVHMATYVKQQGKCRRARRHAFAT